MVTISKAARDDSFQICTCVQSPFPSFSLLCVVVISFKQGGSHFQGSVCVTICRFSSKPAFLFVWKTHQKPAWFPSLFQLCSHAPECTTTNNQESRLLGEIWQTSENPPVLWMTLQYVSFSFIIMTCSLSPPTPQIPPFSTLSVQAFYLLKQSVISVCFSRPLQLFLRVFSHPFTPDRPFVFHCKYLGLLCLWFSFRGCCFIW